MNWLRTYCDREWDRQHLADEELRLERLARQSRQVCHRESTPLGEPVPPTSMSLYRQSQLQQQADRLKELVGEDELKF